MGCDLMMPAASGSVFEALRADGVSDEDIRVALALQETQRSLGVPVLPLRVICGLEEPQRRRDAKTLGHTRALVDARPRGRRKGGLHITKNPVRADSVQTGSDAEAEFVKAPLTQRMRGRLFVAGKKVLMMGRELARQARAGSKILTEREQALVRFTPNCQQILVAMIDNEKYREGWLYPSYEAIMKWTGLSRPTVGRSLLTLRAIGLVEWIRRFVYTRDEVVGARSEQTSNLYRLRLPEWLEKLLGLHTPVPVDEEQRREGALEEHAAMLAGLSAGERRRSMPADSVSIAAIVAAGLRLDRRAREHVATREYQNNPEPPYAYI